jgi:Tol biopolymer transport system component
VAPDVPRDLEKLILRCLRKEPERRFQHMLDVKLELEQIKEDSDSAAEVAPAVPSRNATLRLAVALAGAAAVALAGWLVWRARDPAPSPPRVVHLTTMRGSEWTPALSPDGEQVAFSWDGESSAAGVTPDADIWIKLVGGSEARRVTTGPANDIFPSWSPDGRQIAFLRSTTRYTWPGTSSPQMNGRIHLVSPLGGADRRLSDFPAAFSQLAWSPDGRYLAARRAVLEDDPRETGGLYLVPVSGGEPRAITKPPQPAFDNYPAFSPDGRRLAYASCGDHRNPIPPCDVSVVDLDVDFRPQAPPRRLPRRQKGMIIGLVWTRDGRSLVYSAGAGADQLWRVGADGDLPAERIELAGHLAAFPTTVASRDRLVFAGSLTHTDIFRFEAGRPATVVIGSSYDDYAPSFSPDGRRITLESSRSGKREIWLADADGSNPVQLTQGPGNHQGSPRWSPDGRQIVFDSQGDDGYRDVWTIAVDGGSLRRVTSGPMTEAVGSITGRTARTIGTSGASLPPAVRRRE